MKMGTYTFRTQLTGAPNEILIDSDPKLTSKALLKLSRAARKVFGEYAKRGARVAAKARMAKISSERRSEIARNAVNARWAKKREKDK